MRAWLAFSCALVALAPGIARAADAGSEAAAEALFTEAKKLADAGKYAEACPKFEASQKKSPAAGTLVNLADCYEHEGKIASAWITYKEATRASIARKRADWEKLSRERAAALEPKVPKLSVAPAAGADKPDVVITRDGDAISRSEWGVAIPVDPGNHTIKASAPGKHGFTKTITLAADGKTVEVQVPALEQESAASPVSPGPGAAPAPAGSTGAAPPPRESLPPMQTWGTKSNQKTIGLIVGGVGIAGLVVGGVTGVMSFSKKSDAESQCTSYPNDCADPPAARVANDSARSLATVSTISFIAGGVLLAVGGVLFFTAPSSSSQPAAVRVAPMVGGSSGGAVVSGAF